MTSELALANALRSLDGLSVGDSFGQLFFFQSPHDSTLADLPKDPWRWTDDTHMALSIVEVLASHGTMEQDTLAQAFARRFAQGPFRGYAGGAATLLRQIGNGMDWRQMSPRLFGNGSYGNGAAMRAAPIGGYFADDPEKAALEARLSAVITHAHPEGQAGAVAVAVAAALAASRAWSAGTDFLAAVLPHLPESVTAERVQEAMQIAPDDLASAIRRLGTGAQVTAQDTVPFCLWSAAHHLGRFKDALWWTAKGLGDCDTTCAIVGGIVALSVPEVPSEWIRRREPLSAQAAQE